VRRPPCSDLLGGSCLLFLLLLPLGADDAGAGRPAVDRGNNRLPYPRVVVAHPPVDPTDSRAMNGRSNAPRVARPSRRVGLALIEHRGARRQTVLRGKGAAFGDQEAMGGDTERGMVVEAAPPAPFVRSSPRPVRS
jgi:hypothetical protein